MVEIATSLGRSGLQDWLIQRVTAVILAAFTLFLLGYIVYYPTVNYAEWHLLFQTQWMRYFTFLSLLSLIAHAWVGVWTITTDYVKPIWPRFLVQMLFILALILYMIWGCQIIWGL